MTDYFPSDNQLHPCDLAPGLYTARLSSGLKVIIKEDHRTPVAVCNVWVRVGSNREPEKLRGWSHGIEHMLFKGTGRRQESDFALEVAGAGGMTNAGTGYETTNYHITVPAENLPVAVDILGDALFSSRFDAESLDAERQVLVHENHMYDDIPFGFGVTWRWGMELAFDDSPYRHPIGGRDENLLKRDREDILAFYRSAYAPANMTVVIVGDVAAETALQLVTEKFPATAESGEDAESTAAEDVVLVAAPPVEGSHDGLRLRVEKGDIQKAYAKLIFPGPGEQDPDRPVLSVTRRILSDGRSCRLYREVQERAKLVDEFALMTETGPREGVVLVDLETDPERLSAAIEAVTIVLQDLKKSACTEQELERARVRVMRSFLFGEETVQGRASTLGFYEAMGDLSSAYTFPDRVAQVTRADVARFSRRLFNLDNLSCLIYLPRDCDPEACGVPTTAEQLVARLQPILAATPGPLPWAGAETPPNSAPTVLTTAGAGDDPDIDEFTTVTLAGGVEVNYRVDRTVPIVAVDVCALGGATTETAANTGLAALTQMVQIKGAGARDAETLHAELERLGATLSPQTDRDYSGLILSGLSDRLETPLSILGQCICRPTFPDTEVDQERRLALEQLTALADSPFQWAAVNLRDMIYGDHPYGRPLVGSRTSLPTLTRDDLIRWHRRIWTADNLKIVVSGSFDPDALLGDLEALLADLPAEAEASPLATLEGIEPARGVISRHVTKDQNQSMVLLGWPGTLNPDDQRVPVMMMKEVLNGQSGRLFESLRNRRSLCYNTGTLSTSGFGQGMFVGYVLTAPESAAEARRALLEELVAMGEQMVDNNEFERARTKLIGNLLISSQANSSRVRRALRDRIYGRPANAFAELVEQIRRCTPDQVMAVAARLLDPDNRFEVELGPRPE